MTKLEAEPYTMAAAGETEQGERELITRAGWRKRLGLLGRLRRGMCSSKAERRSRWQSEIFGNNKHRKP